MKPKALQGWSRIDVVLLDGKTATSPLTRGDAAVRRTIPKPSLNRATGLMHSAARSALEPPAKPLISRWNGYAGGERGIRTPDTGLSPYNGLANLLPRRAAPLKTSVSFDFSVG